MILNLGRILTYCPRICEEREEDLKARVAYLLTKDFTPKEIATIVSSSPSWLTFSVRGIDARLGFFQKTFGFLGTEGDIQSDKRVEETNFHVPYENKYKACRVSSGTVFFAEYCTVPFFGNGEITVPQSASIVLLFLFFCENEGKKDYR